MTDVKIHNLSGLDLPQYQTVGAAGVDLLAAVESDLTIEPLERVAVPTGIRVELPKGYELQIRGRSGLAIKHGVTLANGVGTIDSDYTGEICVLLVNLGKEAFTIKRGDRIAQGILAKFSTINWILCDELTDTARGDGGFGSTGK